MIQNTTYTMDVLPRRPDDVNWPVFVNGVEIPSTNAVAAVDSYDQARARADEHGFTLRIAAGAYAQMIEAGVAPEDPPDGLIIL